MIKIGMIGAGAIGMAHSDAILENSECKLSAVCDVDIKKAEQISEKHGAKAHSYGYSGKAAYRNTVPDDIAVLFFRTVSKGGCRYNGVQGRNCKKQIEFCKK